MPKIAAAKRREMALRIAMEFNRLTGTAQAIRPAYKCLKNGWRPALTGARGGNYNSTCLTDSSI
jgi:hypothetical protein